MEARPALSRTQSAVLDAIRTSVRERGFPPTLREVGATVGLASTSSVAKVVQVLAARGYLRHEPNSPRSLTVVDDAPAAPTIAAVRLELDKGHRFLDARYTCPGCGDTGLRTVGITALAYVFEVCCCRETCDYDHLVEQIWHRACLTRSDCADQG